MSYYKKQFNEKTGVYFPQAIVVGKPVSTKQVAERLAKISTVSLADVLAVLAEMPGVLSDYMAQGKSVRLDGLGTFRYSLDTDGVANEDEFDAQAQIKAVRVRFTPQREGAVTKGGYATRALVPNDIEWIEWAGKSDAAPSDDEEDDSGTDTGGTGDGGYEEDPLD